MAHNQVATWAEAGVGFGRLLSRKSLQLDFEYREVPNAVVRMVERRKTSLRRVEQVHGQGIASRLRSQRYCMRVRTPAAESKSDSTKETQDRLCGLDSPVS